MVMTSNKNANYDPLLLHQAHDAVTKADQQKDNQSYKNNDDSLYVDPLDIIEPDRTSTASDAQKAIQDAHERLMNKTGGQPVEEDLGGWLLVITIILIILLIISVIPALAWLLSALSGNVTAATSVIPNTIIAVTTGMFIQNIFQRRNPLRLLAIICTVLVTYGVVELGLFFLDGLSTSISMGLGIIPTNGLTILLMSVFTVISAIAKVILAIVLYGYFSTSKRVRRTLINNDILERPRNR